MRTAIPSFGGSAKTPWNRGRLIGQKRPLRPKEVWAIRVRLQLEGRKRDLALFNLAVDSKLRGWDLVRLRVSDVCVGDRVQDRATVIQQKTGRPVQFEITEQTRAAIRDWLANVAPGTNQYLFPSRFHDQPHISTRQYARIVHRWVKCAGLDDSVYGTHSMRRTKVAQIYKKTGNLRAVQLLLGHTKLESTVRYLGIEVDDALTFRSKSSSDRSRSAALSLAGPLSLHLEDLRRRTEIGKTRRFRPVAGPQWQRLILAIDGRGSGISAGECAVRRSSRRRNRPVCVADPAVIVYTCGKTGIRDAS